MTDAYLDKHAEREAHLALELLRGTRFARAVMIPAFDEDVSMLDTAFAQVTSLAGTLVIVVVNAPHGATDEANVRTARLLAALGRQQGGRRTHEHLALGEYDRFDGSHLLLVDLCGAHRPLANQGVGRARKAGSDIAYALHLHRQLASRWLHVTDADVVLPAHYFDVEPGADAVSCAIYPFTHGERALPYELRLRLYVLGLLEAGSPWAFHTLGSILKVSLPHYAKVRGFPKRAAGEDFYLLNKLAKIGFVENLGGEPVRLSDRASARVPFGTGPAVAAAAVGTGRPMDLPAYDHRIFRLIGPWITRLDHLHEAREAIAAQGLVTWLSEHGVRPPVLEALGAVNADQTFRRLSSRCRQPQQLSHALHTWFDAFKTMRAIHRVRASRFPDVPLADALSASLGPDWPREATADELSRMLAAREPTTPMGLGPA